jgi:REP element-mobilizing transposase RayT
MVKVDRRENQQRHGGTSGDTRIVGATSGGATSGGATSGGATRRSRKRRSRRRGQQAFEFRTWGGKRKGAGRKQVNERKSQPHRVRPEITSRMAMLVTLRVVPNVRRMRRMDAYKALRKALLVVLARTDFRIVHHSIQGNHIHLVVEAEDKRALARGMQAFQASAARRLNQVDIDDNGKVRTGQVFVDRYHLDVVTTPTHARHTLAYVLNDWRRHKEDRAPGTRTWSLDKYSSAISFTGWAERSEWIMPDDYEPLPVSSPQSWLLREGWKLGGAISIYEAPGPR